MLNRRQINVQHRNLASMCRITVKSLIDYACLNTHVDEDCEEFVNFCAVFEQMVSHRLRPYQKKVWHRGQGSPRHFWEVMLENHRQGPLFRTCIPNIEAIESIKSPRAKLRAFVRVALMEKRLSDYLHWLLDNRTLMGESFLDGALFTSEEGLELCGDVIGLSAIDFNFCLRGNENELLGPFEISYAPFLQYSQSPASRLFDEEEMIELSGKGRDSGHVSAPFTDNEAKLQTLERDFRGVKEQKDYLEELIRLRERQMGEAGMRVEAMKEFLRVSERERDTERKTLDTCMLELQEEITTLRTQNSLLKSQVADLQLFKSRLEFRDVQMVDLAYVPVVSGTPTQSLEEEQTDGRPDAMPLLPIQDTASHQVASDQRSILSSLSDQVRLKEDTQSLVPLTGSLADVNIAMIRDNQHLSDEAPTGDWRKRDTGGATSQRGVKEKNSAGDLELTLFQSESQEVNQADGNGTQTGSTLPPLSTENVDDPATENVASTAPHIVDQENTRTGEDTGSKSDDSFVLTEGESEEVTLIEADEVDTEALPKGDEEGEKMPPVDEVSVKSEDQSEAERDNQLHSGAASRSARGEIALALQDLEQAFETGSGEAVVKGDPLQTSIHSDCSGNNGSGQEDVNTSMTSDPELLDRANISSEGSDATWELLSDPEEAGK